MTYVCALVDAPDWLLAVYRDGQCRGIKELYDLRRLHDEHSSDVAAWLAGRTSVSRGDLSALRDRLSQRTVTPSASTAVDAENLSSKAGRLSEPPMLQQKAAAAVPALQGAAVSAAKVSRSKSQEPLHHVALLADHEGEAVRVWLDLPVDCAGHVWVSKANGLDSEDARHSVSLMALNSLRLVDRLRAV